MNDQSREALNAYYAEADSWGHDRNDALRASRRVAWFIAGFATIVAMMLAAAVIVMMPLKTVVPYTLLVDRHTGFVQALEPLDPQKISGDAALTQSFLVQYVIARESFDIDALQANYRRVTLWSADAARSRYLSGVQSSNPDSPLARLPRSTIVETHVKSVSPLQPGVAMVRFETVRRDAGQQPRPPEAWVSTVRYGYSGEPMRLEDRMINPLGFQVQRYQRSAEMLQPPEPAATAATAAAAQAMAAGGHVAPAPIPVQVTTGPTQTPTQASQIPAAPATRVAVPPAPAPTAVQAIPAPAPVRRQGQGNGDRREGAAGNRGGFNPGNFPNGQNGSIFNGPGNRGGNAQ